MRTYVNCGCPLCGAANSPLGDDAEFDTTCTSCYGRFRVLATGAVDTTARAAGDFTAALDALISVADRIHDEHPAIVSLREANAALRYDCAVAMDCQRTLRERAYIVGAVTCVALVFAFVLLAHVLTRM